MTVGFRRAALVCAAAIALSTHVAGPARAATEIIDAEFNTCTGINCSPTTIAGLVDSAAGKVLPWVAKILAVQNTCLRLEMVFIAQPAANLEMTVVSPNPNIRYRDDQGGTACANCAMVKINPTPANGYYTVIVSSANGAAVNTDFHLRFGQYNAGNPNCASPTTALP